MGSSDILLFIPKVSPQMYAKFQNSEENGTLNSHKRPNFFIKLPYTRFKIPSLYRKSKTPGRSWLVVKEVAVVIASNTEQCPLIYRDNGLN